MKRIQPMRNGVDDMTGANGERLLDALIEKFRLKNDAALARLLELQPPLLSKVRHNISPVSAAILLRIHDAFGLPIAQIRELARDE